MLFQEDMYAYSTRPRRTILEVLLEFKSVRIPLEYLFDVFPPIRLRQFSIASSLLVRWSLDAFLTHIVDSGYLVPCRHTRIEYNYVLPLWYTKARCSERLGEDCVRPGSHAPSWVRARRYSLGALH
jgi:hypothetical protein